MSSTMIIIILVGIVIFSAIVFSFLRQAHQIGKNAMQRKESIQKQLKNNEVQKALVQLITKKIGGNRGSYEFKVKLDYAYTVLKLNQEHFLTSEMDVYDNFLANDFELECIIGTYNDEVWYMYVENKKKEPLISFDPLGINND